MKQEEYGIQFLSHGDSHEVSIDLGCLANALKPYFRNHEPLRSCDQPEHLYGCVCGSMRPKDLVQEKIKEITGGKTCTRVVFNDIPALWRSLEELVALVRAQHTEPNKWEKLLDDDKSSW